MSDDQLIKEVVQANQELATRNSRVAVDVANKTRDDLTVKLVVMERTITNLVQQVANLQQKYNLLLSNRFNKGSTSTEE